MYICVCMYIYIYVGQFVHLEAGLPLSMVLTECSMLYGTFEVPMCQVSVPLFLCHVPLEDMPSSSAS